MVGKMVKIITWSRAFSPERRLQSTDNPAEARGAEMQARKDVANSYLLITSIRRMLGIPQDSTVTRTYRTSMVS
jgi:hypothetical protein